MRDIKRPAFPLQASALLISVILFSACTHQQAVRVKVVDLSAKPVLPNVDLYKHKGDRLIWFSSQAVSVGVHVGSQPVPFSDMTDSSGAPCPGSGDCYVKCHPDSTGSVCVSGKIIVTDDQINAAGGKIYYGYDSVAAAAGGKKIDPGFTIRP
jgi:hypothetical protein